MTANRLLVTLVVMILLLPAQLMAGGPPMLCLPIDGVTQQNAELCTRLLADKLHDKLWSHSDAYPAVRLQQHAGQWYLTAHMEKNIGLSDVAAALQETQFAIPRDKLRLFGHVTLVIDSRSPDLARLLADLESVESISVAESKVNGSQVLVKVDMPYPVPVAGQSRSTVGWNGFERNDFTSDPKSRSEGAVTAQKLPGYDRIRHLVAKHQATLKDVFWSEHDACRVLGGVAETPIVASE